VAPGGQECAGLGRVMVSGCGGQVERRFPCGQFPSYPAAVGLRFRSLVRYRSRLPIDKSPTRTTGSPRT